MTRISGYYYWYVSAFLGLFLLSLDYWWWDAAVQLQWLGLPRWIYYFIFLQLLFGAVFYRFSKQYWRDDAD